MSKEGSDASSQRLQELVRLALENSSLAPIEIQRIVDRDGEFLNGLRGLIGRFKTDVLDYDQAYNILGDDFISPLETADPREIVGGRSLAYTREQLETFAATLPSRQTLEWCKTNGFIVVAGPPRPLSLFNIATLKRQHFCFPRRIITEGCIKDTPGKIGPDWILLRKQPSLVLNPMTERVNVTISQLPKEERPAHAAEQVWGMIVYREKTSRLLVPPNQLIATADRVTDGTESSSLRRRIVVEFTNNDNWTWMNINVRSVSDDKDIAVWNPLTLERRLATVRRNIG